MLDQGLERLAAAWGIDVDYEDGLRHRRRPSPEALRRILSALGADVDDPESALRQRQEAPWRRGLPPVTVAWDDTPAQLLLRAPSAVLGQRAELRVTFEDGAARDGSRRLPDAAPVGTRLGDQEWVEVALPLPSDLPWGYHDVTLRVGDVTSRTHLIAAPRTAEPLDAAHRAWGAFLPLYALRTARDWGVGDFTDLAAAAARLAHHGADTFATLPLLAVFLDQPHEPGPYSPISRLFWNEIYLDVTRPPEFQAGPQTQALVHQESFQKELRRLRADPIVHYRDVARLKRGVLEAMLGELPRVLPDRHRQFRAFVEARPDIRDYATFRSRCERHGSGWQGWPEDAGGVDATAADYHAYTQWLLEEQLPRRTESNDARVLYLDFPLGVHGGGYDAWRERETFAQGVAVGAPPDAFFTNGQDWGFPPAHPERQRETGHAYFARALRNHMQRARALRLDHVMALHRLFWIPRGHDATDGAYVPYPSEELYAVLCLESRRARTPVIGEDLGTVPNDVRAALDAHGVYRMHVFPFEVRPAESEPLPAVPAEAMACLNTHDMPTFAAYWGGLDIDDRLEQGLLTAHEAAQETAARRAMREAVARSLRSWGHLGPREEGPAAVRDACLGWLATSRSPLLIVNLEDLWLETQPQNRPGLGQGPLNWRRRARHSVEDWESVGVDAALARVGAARQRGLGR